MATTTSSTAVATTSVTGLRAGASCSAKAKVSAAAPSAKLPGPIKASFKDLGVVVAATAASAMLVGNAMAMEEVLQLGGDFKGEKITTLKNINAHGFLQKIVLEEEEDAGVDVAKKSRTEEGGGGRYSMWVDENFDCATQQGPHMDAKQMQRKLLARLMMPW